MVALSTLRHAGAAATLFALGASAAVMEKMASVPTGWTDSGATAPNQPITLEIALQMQNIDQLESKLLDVSTPGSANYGKHLSMEEVNAMFAPSAASVSAVTNWLKSAGVQQTSSDGQVITFATTVEKANQLLGAGFKNFVDRSGNVKVRTSQYSVPDAVAQYIDIVSPTTYLGTVRANAAIPSQVELARRAAAAPAAIPNNCSEYITPACLKSIYNYGNYTPDPRSGAYVGFGSFLNQSANYKDLAQFQQLFKIPSQSFSVHLINGGINNQTQDENINGEANLDVQYLNGMSHPMPITEFITGGSPPIISNVDEPPGFNQNEPYLPYYQYLLHTPNSALPQVISNSYGDDEGTVPYAYARRVCNAIGLMGLRGISILESAGDIGIGSGCRTHDGSPRFTPQFPSSCPFVTSVGGTQSNYPEIAWTAGSGGFSDYFPRPRFQADAVNTYLTQHVSKETLQYYAPYFNASGRGFPDVSAHSLLPDYIVVYESQVSLSGGTSAACPVFSSLIAQLNDARFRQGKGSLGWLNPLLYTIGKSGLTDITGGQSDGCNGIDGQTNEPVPGGAIIPGAHWNATEGWDPVTGLGTPNFQALLKLATKY